MTEQLADKPEFSVVGLPDFSRKDEKYDRILAALRQLKPKESLEFPAGSKFAARQLAKTLRHRLLKRFGVRINAHVNKDKDGNLYVWLAEESGK